MKFLKVIKTVFRHESIKRINSRKVIIHVLTCVNLSKVLDDP